MGKNLVIVLTVISAVIPFIVYPFYDYAEHFFLDMLFVSFFGFVINLFLAFAIRTDSIENKKSDWWKVLGFLAIVFGWVIGAIYLYTYSANYTSKINKVKKDYENSFKEFNSIKNQDDNLDSNLDDTIENNIFDTTADFSFIKNEKAKEILYYDNGKPVYKKDIKSK